ncbi:hypothetical protein [Maritimibacter sp. HL-12]|uniref:hypothetical protein n=1 Tax=Maritimibacter sp. HL-12 TaxID=1162418 RepID=UPI000A0F1E10|nr:hypothetical protein [Maritimibacter sp. HL-12]SMH36027.1 hypothetical protein SAMN05661107_0677 [Maritimibacter sp. HL-12]
MRGPIQKHTSVSLRLRLLSRLRGGAAFTKGALRVALDAQEGQLREVLNRLRDDGWIEEVGLDPRRSKLLALTEAGKRGAEGELSTFGQLKGDAQTNMWRTARRMREFTPVDLTAWASVPGAEVDLQAARAFCAILLRGGYVRVVRKAKSGVNEAIYRLINDTGPRPPVEKRVRAIYDANEERLVHVPGSGQ